MKKNLFKLSVSTAVVAFSFIVIMSCSKEDSEDGHLSKSLIMSINLSSNEGSGLANNSSSIIRDNIVIVKNQEGNFVAVSEVCSHDQSKEIRFTNVNSGTFYCHVDGTRYDQAGNSVNSLTTSKLKTYNVVVKDNILQIFE